MEAIGQTMGNSRFDRNGWAQAGMYDWFQKEACDPTQLAAPIPVLIIGPSPSASFLGTFVRNCSVARYVPISRPLSSHCQLFLGQARHHLTQQPHQAHCLHCYTNIVTLFIGHNSDLSTVGLPSSSSLSDAHAIFSLARRRTHGLG